MLMPNLAICTNLLSSSLSNETEFCAICTAVRSLYAFLPQPCIDRSHFFPFRDRRLILIVEYEILRS